MQDDLTNKNFGRLRALRRGKSRGKHGYWLCVCECGRRKLIRTDSLLAGMIRSCGCYYRETRTTTIKHGQCRITCKTGTYSAYQRKKSLCLNPRGRMARYYKSVRFLFTSFAEFYADVGDKPGPDYWLVRIDDTKHIEPGNLEWRPIRRRRRKRTL
jgi:hypothetical protein